MISQSTAKAKHINTYSYKYMIQNCNYYYFFTRNLSGAKKNEKKNWNRILFYKWIIHGKCLWIANTIKYLDLWPESSARKSIKLRFCRKLTIARLKYFLLLFVLTSCLFIFLALYFVPKEVILTALFDTTHLVYSLLCGNDSFLPNNSTRHRNRIIIK